MKDAAARWIQAASDFFNDNEGAATWLLVVLGAAAGVTALVQLRQDRELRFQAARPYVSAGMRRVGHGIVELYVKNFGETAAQKITLSSTPELTSLTDTKAFRIFESLPSLAPGEEWSTIWEVKAWERNKKGAFSNAYDVTLKYQGLNGKRLRDIESIQRLDWDPHLKTTYIAEDPLRDLSKSVRNIEAALSKGRVLSTGIEPASSAPAVPTPAKAVYRSRWSLICEALAPRPRQ